MKQWYLSVNNKIDIYSKKKYVRTLGKQIQNAIFIYFEF